VGTGIPTRFLRVYDAIKGCDSSFFADKCMYVLPFCDDVDQAYMGKLQGYIQFPKNNNFNLSITPGGAAFNEVQLLSLNNMTGPMVSGHFKLKYKEFTLLSSSTTIPQRQWQTH